MLYDLLIIGGGINGCAIARDAAGRGLRVVLAEKGDLGGATSSASTKLFHGGLRYLEYLELRLVREALTERETLLRAMPHIARPMRFVLPLHPQMRFETDTPVSRLMPWTKGRRPAWMIRAGLWLYDHLGGREILPGTRKCALTGQPEGASLRPEFKTAYEYSDVWVDDARLVMLTARDAQARGARILTRQAVTQARVQDGLWHLRVGAQDLRARMVVNAAGPWVDQVLRGPLGQTQPPRVRLVRGSHLVTRRLFDHDKAYFFQGEDGRIIFAIPYEGAFTLLGTTDAPHPDPDQSPVCSAQERDYLLAFANRYFARPVQPCDIVHSYAGVRPLFDDGAARAAAATRDYRLEMADPGAPVLSVYGGKITTHRRLAQSAMDKIAAYLPVGAPWTAGVALPGGDFAPDGRAALCADLRAAYPFLDAGWAERLISAYGTEAARMLGDARSATDLGQDFGATLHAREVDWMVAHEFAQTEEDVLWRRSKLGLHIAPGAVARYLDKSGSPR